MKFSTSIALFAAGVLAAPSASDLCTREEVSTVNTIMTTVLEGIQSLDATCASYTGGPGQELVDASNKMLTIIRTATNNAASMLPLTMDEAIAFQPLSDKLNAAGDKLLTDIQSKTPLFAQSCICEVTLNWVAQIGGNVNTLMTTISTKFPAGGKGGDEIQHFNKIFADMQTSLSECSGKACSAGSGGSGGNKGSSPTQAAAPTASSTAHSGKGNGTKEAAPTGSTKPVVTAGSAVFTFSGAAMAAAIAAFFL